MKGRIQLPIRATPVSEPKKISIEEFYAKLKENPEVRRIFREYANIGGNSGLLLHYVWIDCCPPVKFSNEVVTDTFNRLRESVEQARLILRHHAVLLPPDVLDKAGNPFFDALRDVWKQLNDEQFVKGFLDDEKTDRGVGRPPGADPSNFAAAVLAMEFKSRYGHPKLADIVTLITAAEPKRFGPDSCATDVARLAIDRLRNSKDFDRIRNYWEARFGDPDTFPDRRFTDWSDPS